MFKKTIIIFSLTGLFSLAHAETCPNINNLQFNQWKPFNRDSGEPATSQELKEFKKSVRSFSLGYFLPGAPEGEAQCYYSGFQNDYLDVYLARQDLKSDFSKSWVRYPDGRLECKTTDEGKCVFIKK